MKWRVTYQYRWLDFFDDIEQLNLRRGSDIRPLVITPGKVLKTVADTTSDASFYESLLVNQVELLVRLVTGDLVDGDHCIS